MAEKTEKQALESIAEKVRKEFGEEMKMNISVRRKIAKTPDFIMVYQKVGKEVLEGKLSMSALKVFFYLLMSMEFENFIGINLNSLAEAIKMPLITVKVAMRHLKEAGMIMSIKDNFDARRNVYRLNPIVAWKGKVNNRTRAIKINPNQTLLFGATG